MSSKTPEIKYKFFKQVPRPAIDRLTGKMAIIRRRVPKDPYDIRIEERISKKELPPEEPPVELAQNE